MKYVLVFCIVAIMALWIPHRMDQKYAEGVAEGKRLALRITPPSEALETACLSLWVSQQNKKAAAKEI